MFWSSTSTFQLASSMLIMCSDDTPGRITEGNYLTWIVVLDLEDWLSSIQLRRLRYGGHTKWEDRNERVFVEREEPQGTPD